MKNSEENKIDVCILLNLFSAGGSALKKWDLLIQNKFFIKNNINIVSCFKIEKNYLNVKEEIDNWIYKNLLKKQIYFIAAGGDGTVHILCNHLEKYKNFNPIMGAIGLGSSNDFHKINLSYFKIKKYNIPFRLNFREAIFHDLCEYKIQKENYFKKIYSLINGSIGFTSESNKMFNRDKYIKRISSNLSILISILKTLSIYKCEKILLKTCNKDIHLNNISIGIIKNPHFGGSLKFNNKYISNNGCIDINYFSYSPNDKNYLIKFKIIKILIQLLTNSYEKNKLFNSINVSQAEIYSNNTFNIEIDGEIYEGKKIEINVIKESLKVCP